MPLLPGMRLPAGTEENNPRNDTGRVTLALVLRDTRSTAVVWAERSHVLKKGQKREAAVGQTKAILQLYGLQTYMGETKETPEPIFPSTNYLASELQSSAPPTAIVLLAYLRI